jgi:hypothetical protein
VDKPSDLNTPDTLREDAMKNFRVAVGTVIFFWILNLAFLGAVIYVAWHFISKWW